MKRHIFRVGDRVRVIRPRWIERIGYPLIWTELIDEVETDPRTRAAYKALGFDDVPMLPSRFIQIVAMMRVKERGFGGRERKIIYMDHPPTEFLPKTLEIIGKRTAKTGTYFPSWGGYDSQTGEYDWEPGGLADEKTHIILQTHYGEIESCDVEPMAAVEEQS